MRSNVSYASQKPVQAKRIGNYNLGSTVKEQSKKFEESASVPTKSILQIKQLLGVCVTMRLSEFV
jgi:hypothetical protein